MSDNEEKTIVIDIEKLKRELNIGSSQPEKKSGDQIDQSIEFAPQQQAVSSEDQLDVTEMINMSDMEIDLGSEVSPAPEEIKEPKIKQKPMVFFDHKSNYFSSHLKKQNDHILIVSTLEKMNEQVKDREPKVVIFNYMVQPNMVNQLMKQLREKFTHITRVIVGRKLSANRVQMHQQSPYGADFYLDLDSSSDISLDLEKILTESNLKRSA